MVNRVRKHIALSMLALFTMQVLFACSITFLMEQNREHQHEKLANGHTGFITFHLSEKEFRSCYIPKQHELHWKNNFYDIRSLSKKNDTYRVVLLIDKKEKSLTNLAKKQQGKSAHKNTAAKQLVFVSDNEKEWASHFFLSEEEKPDSSDIKNWKKNPYVKIPLPPPDCC